MRVFLLLAALLPTFPAAASAQDLAPVAPGSRIRILAAPQLLNPADASRPWRRADLLRGEFLVGSVRGDTLILHSRAGADGLPMPVSRLVRLEVNAGRRSPVAGLGRGMLGGLLVGGPLGGLAGLVSYSLEDRASCPVTCVRFGPEVAIAAGAVLGLAGGTVVGGIVGALRPGSRWEPVPLPW